MRTLRKALALVLCVVMVMGLFAFSVSAKSINDYSDAQEIAYPEAASVLSALGVITGKDDGTYDPKGELTRAEAAVIITRLLDINPAGKSTFTDIRDPFYDPYIGYLQSQGFVNGYGDGRFGPDDKLTGSAFGKMLLVALGYEAEIEGMTGEQWELGVAKLLKSTNIIGSIVPFNQTSIVTREVAAQMSLNSLKAKTVEYPSGGVQVTTTDGTEVKVNQGKAEEVTTSTLESRNNISDKKTSDDADAKSYVELGEQVFTNLRLEDSEQDGFGRPSNTWTLNGNEIVKAAKTAVATIYEGTSESNISNALRGYKIFVGSSIAEGSYRNISNNENTELGDYILTADDDTTPSNAKGDGKPASLNDYRIYSISDTNAYKDSKWPVQATESGWSVAKTLAENLAKDKEGAVVEFFANDDNYITHIVVTYYTVGEVTNVQTASNGDIIYTIKGRNMRDYADPTVKDTIQVAGSLDKGDFVTICRPGGTNEVNYVYKTEKVTGVQTAKDSSSKITVDGNTMTVGRGVYDIDDEMIGGDYGTFKQNKDMWKTSGTSRNFYRDRFGYVVHADEGTANITDYAVVADIAYDDASGVNTDDKVTAILVFTDGTQRTVEIDSINGIDVNDNDTHVWRGSDFGGTANRIEENSSDNGIYTNRIVTYSVKSNGHYEIKYSKPDFENFGFTSNLPASSDYAKKVESTVSQISRDVMKKGTATVYLHNNLTINTSDNTIYIVRGTKSSDFNVYTGFRSAPTVRAGTTPLTVSYVRDGSIRLVYIDGTKSDSIVSADKDVFYATTDTYTTETVDGKTVYKIEGILKDEKVTLTSEKEDHFENIKKNYLYTIEFNGNNYVDKTPNKLNTSFGVVDLGNNEVDGEDVLSTTGCGVASSDDVKDISGGQFVGFTWTSSSKFIVVDDGNLVADANMQSISAGDAYYIQTVGDSGVDGSTIKNIYVHKGAFVSMNTRNTADIQEQLKSEDRVINNGSINSTGDLSINNKQVILANHDSIDFYGELSVYNTKSDTEFNPALVVNGNLTMKYGSSLLVHGVKNKLMGRLDVGTVVHIKGDLKFEAGSSLVGTYVSDDDTAVVNVTALVYVEGSVEGLTPATETDGIVYSETDKSWYKA